jgi:hypothetical protein
MRPKRRILLYAFGAVERGSLAHVLRVRGYHVVEADSPQDAVGIAADPSEDLHGVLVRQWHPADLSIRAVIGIGKTRAGSNLMFVGCANEEMHAAGFRPTIWLGAEASNAEILESLRILVERKRGPRRKIPAKTEAAS